MSGPVLDKSYTIMCPHGGTAQVIPTNLLVSASNNPVLVLSDMALVAGCPFTLPTVPPKPSPCIRIQWTAPATKVLANGVAVLVQSTVGLCFSPDSIPQGPAVFTPGQIKATAL